MHIISLFENQSKRMYDKNHHKYYNDIDESRCTYEGHCSTILVELALVFPALDAFEMMLNKPKGLNKIRVSIIDPDINAKINLQFIK